jgi:ribosomal protein S18 acetylase RimI-like enzyme
MIAGPVTLGPDLSLDPVRPDEIALLTRLQRAAYAPWLPVLGLEPLPYRADYAALLADHEAWFARRPDGEEIGALILGVEPDQLLIWSVAVSAQAAGQGIGQALLRFSEAEAVRRGLGRVRLYTNALMARNIALYLKAGYVETGRETTPDGRHVVHMAKAVG